MRWVLALQRFNFKVERVKGKDYVGADFLSRANWQNNEFYCVAYIDVFAIRWLESCRWLDVYELGYIVYRVITECCNVWGQITLYWLCAHC